MTSVSLVVWKIEPSASSAGAGPPRWSGCRCGRCRSVPSRSCTTIGWALATTEEPGRRVARVADGAPPRQTRERLGREDLGDVAHAALDVHPLAVPRQMPVALLAAMLEGVEPEVDVIRGVVVPLDAEDAAHGRSPPAARSADSNAFLEPSAFGSAVVQIAAGARPRRRAGPVGRDHQPVAADLADLERRHAVRSAAARKRSSWAGDDRDQRPRLALREQVERREVPCRRAPSRGPLASPPPMVRPRRAPPPGRPRRDRARCARSPADRLRSSRARRASAVEIDRRRPPLLDAVEQPQIGRAAELAASGRPRRAGRSGRRPGGSAPSARRPDRRSRRPWPPSESAWIERPSVSL